MKDDLTAATRRRAQIFLSVGFVVLCAGLWMLSPVLAVIIGGICGIGVGVGMIQISGELKRSVDALDELQARVALARSRVEQVEKQDPQ